MTKIQMFGTFGFVILNLFRISDLRFLIKEISPISNIDR
jgi:hypothetical protein